MLRCNLELAYDRFITSFNYKDTQKTVLNSSSGVVNSNDVVAVTEKSLPQYQINRNKQNVSRRRGSAFD